jgi:gamma-glutamylcyclotransferase (GGCT)/AIG2-like uncharacterized protein YtfP
LAISRLGDFMTGTFADIVALDAMTSHLFVYGTLLSTAGHAMGARLRRQARRIGEASIRGRLYRVGRYPGLVETEDLDQVVHGELYALDNPATALKWLDAYEGVVPECQDQNEYQRAERPVRLASGEEVAAWVYLYRKDVRRLPPIPGGRWSRA